MSSITPRFELTEVKELLTKHYQLSGELVALESYCDLNFRLKKSDGSSQVVKIANTEEQLHELEMQNAAMLHLAQHDMPVPQVVENQEHELITKVQKGEQEYYLRVLSFLPGSFYADTSSQGEAIWSNLGSFMGRVTTSLANFEHRGAYRYLDWDLAFGYSVCQQKKSALIGDQKTQVEKHLANYHNHVLPIVSKLPQQVIHNDANDYNLLIDSTDKPTIITGLIDFGDMVFSHRINELAITCAYALMNQEDIVKPLVSIIKSYHQHCPLEVAEIESLYYLIALRLCTSVCNSAVAIQAAPDNEYLLVSAKPAWRLLSQMEKIAVAAINIQLKEACGLTATKGRTKDDIKQYRQKHLSKNLSLSYQEPLKIIRGQGAYLYDEQGQAYLDMVNNVCHVGHCHPKVVAAGQSQMAQLNTNTRYLHDNIINFSEKLLATMPEKLSVCMLVNSGSEANELAFRLARNYSAHRGFNSKELLVVDGAYHGNTNACIEASSYKFDGPGGQGAEPYVHTVKLPDPYRNDCPSGFDLSDYFAGDVERTIAELAADGKHPSAFICESIQGVAGQIVMPEGYLKKVYEQVRAAGGVCIADEVQVGFGRVGEYMWAFESQQVVPDIVTLGKPIGNGHPLAAVITTQEIADAFVTGMEYFNTFGGNPVSCAIGEAVLDVIEEEKLQQNAKTVGDFMQAELKRMQAVYSVIGDVRGMGLFIGVELVKDRQTKAPAAELTKELIEYFKANYILLSIEGPLHNILKIKPPIVFDLDDARKFLAVLESGLKRYGA